MQTHRKTQETPERLHHPIPPRATQHRERRREPQFIDVSVLHCSSLNEPGPTTQHQQALLSPVAIPLRAARRKQKSGRWMRRLAESSARSVVSSRKRHHGRTSLRHSASPDLSTGAKSPHSHVRGASCRLLGFSTKRGGTGPRISSVRNKANR